LLDLTETELVELLAEIEADPLTCVLEELSDLKALLTRPSPSETGPTPEYLTAKQAGRLYGLSQSALSRLVRRGHLPASKPPGSSTLYRRADLEGLIAAHPTRPDVPPAPRPRRSLRKYL
jgi:excisionase family DNA binding protein